MNILILGGTGFIGSHLSPMLDKHKIFIFHHQNLSFYNPSYTYIKGTRDHFDLLFLKLCNIRIDLIIDMNSSCYNDALFVIRYAKYNSIPVYCFSSISVYHAYAIFLNIENSPPTQTSIVESSCLRRVILPYSHVVLRDSVHNPEYLRKYDKLTVEFAYLSHLPDTSVILRLPYIYGSFDKSIYLTSYISRMIDERPYILLHKSAAEWINTRCYVGNLIQFILNLIESNIFSGIFNVIDQEPLCEHMWIRLLAEVVGWRGNVLFVDDILDGISLPPINEFPLSSNYCQSLDMSSNYIGTDLYNYKMLPLSCTIERTIQKFSKSMSKSWSHLYEIENSYIDQYPF